MMRAFGNSLCEPGLGKEKRSVPGALPCSQAHLGRAWAQGAALTTPAHWPHQRSDSSRAVTAAEQ